MLVTYFLNFCLQKSPYFAFSLIVLNFSTEYDTPKLSGLFFLLRSQLSARELFCMTCCFSLTIFEIFSFNFWQLDHDAPRSVFTCFRFSKILVSSMFSTKFGLVSPYFFKNVICPFPHFLFF